jgi:ATP-binding cassette subfamily C protein CydD
MNFDRRLLRQALTARLTLATAIAMGLLGALAIIFQARQVSTIVARVFLEQQTLQEVQPLLFGLLGWVLLRSLATLFSDAAAGSTALRIKQALRQQLASKIISLGPAYLRNQPNGSADFLSVAIQGIDALEAYFSQFLPQLILAALIPAMMLFVILPLDPLTGLILALTAPLLPLFLWLVGSASAAVTRRQWTALSRMNAFFLDTLQGLTTLKTLALSRAQDQRIATISERYRQATMNVLRVTFLSALVLELVGTISTAIVAVEVGLRLLADRIAFEQAFFLLILAPEFYWPLRQVGLRFHAASTGVAAAQKLFAILNAETPSVPIPTQSTPTVLAAPKRICFERVSYTYSNRSTPALQEVSFELRAGQQTALIGPNGSGKTTLAWLLLRFLTPTNGQIRVDDHLLSEVPITAWHNQLVWVSQRPHLLQGSLAENLRLAYPGAAEAQLWQALRAAHLAEWVAAQPFQLETTIGEGGASLSSGQIQRLALARAFLRPANLILLDEPTAHIDPVEEALLEEATRQLLDSGKTCLVIAHRLPTIQRADWLIALQAGQIVEQGRPADLSNGIYARLWQAYQG